MTTKHRAAVVIAVVVVLALAWVMTEPAVGGAGDPYQYTVFYIEEIGARVAFFPATNQYVWCCGETCEFPVPVQPPGDDPAPTLPPGDDPEPTRPGPEPTDPPDPEPTKPPKEDKGECNNGIGNSSDCPPPGHDKDGDGETDPGKKGGDNDNDHENRQCGDPGNPCNKGGNKDKGNKGKGNGKGKP